MTDVTELPEATEEIVVDCELDASPDKVWRALTVPELAEDWLGASNGSTGGDAERTFEIVEAEPCTRVRYGWHDRSEEAPRTVVTVDIAPAPDGRTRFRLVHARAAGTPVAVNNNRPALIARAA